MIKQTLTAALCIALSLAAHVASAVEEGDPAPDFSLPSIYSDKPDVTF